MTAYQCDICGRYFGEIPEGDLTVWDEENKLDICPACYQRLDNLVHPKRRQQKKIRQIETPELNGGFVFR